MEKILTSKLGSFIPIRRQRVKYLFRALIQNDTVLLRQMIQAGADVNSRNKDGQTLLHEAVKMGSSECTQTLLQAGADVNSKNEYDCMLIKYMDSLQDVTRMEPSFMCEATPLHVATAKNFSGLVSLLLDSGADVNATGSDRFTPLHYAAKYGRVYCADILIKRGADVNSKNKDRCTPLHFAAMHGHCGCTRLLIDAGADVNSEHYEGFTALHESALQGHLECVELLVQCGADVNALASWGISVLSCSLESLDCMQFLLKEGSFINYPENTSVHLNNIHSSLKVIRHQNDEDDTKEEELFWTPSALALFFAAGQILYCFPEERLHLSEQSREIKEDPANEQIESNEEVVTCVEQATNLKVDENSEDSTSVVLTEQTGFKNGSQSERRSESCEDLVQELTDDLNVGLHLSEHAPATECELVKDDDTQDSSTRMTSDEHRNAREEASTETKHFADEVSATVDSNQVILQMICDETEEPIEEESITPESSQQSSNLVSQTRSKTSNLNRQFKASLSLLSRRTVTHESLKSLCRNVIRKHLVQLESRGHLFGKVSALNLPHALQSYLVFDMGLERDTERLHEAVIAFWRLVN